MRDYLKIQRRFERLAFEDLAAKDLNSTVRPSYYSAMLERMAMDVVKSHSPTQCDKALIQCLLEEIGAFNDPCTQLLIHGNTAWKPENPGFKVRRYEDRLIVTEVTGDTRFAVGDVITRMQNNSIPDYTKQVWRTLRSTIPENEDWRIALWFSATVHVLRDGQEIRLPLMRFDPEFPVPQNAVSFRDNVCVLRVDSLADRETISSLLNENREAVSECKGIILDLRTCTSNSGECDALLPLLVEEPCPRSEVMKDEGMYLLYSQGNKRLFRQEMEALLTDQTDEQTHAEMTELMEEMDRKQGWVFEPADTEEDEIILPYHSPRLIVLTDRETGPDAELFIEAGRRSGKLTVIGRNTLGALDYVRPVVFRFDDALSVVYSTGMRTAAYNGKKINGIGLAPDIHIPWTPDCLCEDADLKAALEMLK